MSKAQVQIDPPKKKKSGKGLPPPETKASQNLSKPETGELKPLNFTVPAEFRKKYKLFATNNNMSMVQLLVESFDIYRDLKH